MCVPVGQCWPRSEHEIRPIAACQPAFQKAVWEQCIALNDFTEKTMREIIAELRPKKEKKPKPKRAKPVTIKLPGVKVVIEATKKGIEIDPVEVLSLAIDQLSQQLTEARRQAA